MSESGALRIPTGHDDVDLHNEDMFLSPFSTRGIIDTPFMTALRNSDDDTPPVISESPLTSLVRYWKDTAERDVTASPKTSVQMAPTFGYLTKPKIPSDPLPPLAKYVTSLPPYWRESTECEVLASPETWSWGVQSNYLAKPKTPPAPFPSFAKYVTSLPPSWREKTDYEALGYSETPFQTEITDCLAAPKTPPAPFPPIAKYVTSLPPSWREKTEYEALGHSETPLEVEVLVTDFLTAPKTPPAPFPSFAKYATSLPHRPFSELELIAFERDSVFDVQPNFESFLIQLDSTASLPSQFDEDIVLNLTELQQLEAVTDEGLPPLLLELPVSLDDV